MENLVKFYLFKGAYKLETLIDQVKKFFPLNPSAFYLSRIDEGTGIIQTPTSNDAFYHKGQYDSFNDSHYERLVKKAQKKNSEGSPYSTPTIPHKGKKSEIERPVCLFCDKKDYKDQVTAAGE